MNPEYFMTLVFYKGDNVIEIILLALAFGLGYVLAKVNKEK